MERTLSPYITLALLAISVFLTLLYFDTNRAVPSYIAQQIQYLDKKPVPFDEPINVGSGLLVYATSKTFGISNFIALKAWQVLCFSGYLCILYAITSSMRFTLLSMAYPPLIIDSYQAYTAIGICLYALAIFFTLRKKTVLAFCVSLPLMLISQEACVFFIGVLLYEFIKQKAYANISATLKFLNAYILPITLLGAAICIYLYTQYNFYGSPIANFIYNQTNTKTFNFSISVYIVRIAIFTCIFVTSWVLYKYNKLLCLINSLFFVTYLYFAIFGYDYLFIAIQRFYSGLIIYTIIALGYYYKIPMKLWV